MPAMPRKTLPTGGTPMIQATWSDSSPIVETVTFGHADPAINDEARFRAAAVCRAKKIGATITHGEGAWEGAIEPSTSYRMLNAGPYAALRIIRAAISAGCEAVQLERSYPDGSRTIHEYRD